MKRSQVSNLICDLNCDLGELPEMLADGREAALMQCIASANIACGGHAGDRHTMEASVSLAMEFGVRIGAHPSYPDRLNFGRDAIQMSEADLEKSLTEQIAALVAVAEQLGAEVTHVKPHGALYHAADKDAAVARVIGNAARRVSSQFVLVGRAGSPMLDTWREMRFAVAGEAFADRKYEASGRLRSRDLPDALIQDPEKAAQQARMIATEHKTVAADGTEIPIHADTICIHGDTPGAVNIARAVRTRLLR